MKYFLILSFIFLSGCQTAGLVVGKVRDANDNAVKSAEFTLCEAMPIGAIKRNYQGARAKTYAEFCDSGSVEDLINAN